MGTPPGNRRSHRCGHQPRSVARSGSPRDAAAPRPDNARRRSRRVPRWPRSGTRRCSAGTNHTRRRPAPAPPRLRSPRWSPPIRARTSSRPRRRAGSSSCRTSQAHRDMPPPGRRRRCRRQRRRPAPRAAKPRGDRPQSGPQRSVVIDPGVAGDSAVGPGGPRWLRVGEIRPCRDDDRPSTRHRSGRIGGAFRIAVRERHPCVEAGRPSSDQLPTRPIEHARRSNAKMLDAVLARHRPKLAERRQRLVGAHRISVRFPTVATPPRTGSARPGPAAGSPAPSPGRRPRRHRCAAVATPPCVPTPGAAASNPCSECSWADHDEGVSCSEPPAPPRYGRRDGQPAAGGHGAGRPRVHPQWFGRQPPRYPRRVAPRRRDAVRGNLARILRDDLRRGAR